jgi:hypothetical protein
MRKASPNAEGSGEARHRKRAKAKSRTDDPFSTILQIELNNVVRYAYDTPDYSAFAKDPTAINETYPTFATWVTEGDLGAVNGQPARVANYPYKRLPGLSVQ